MVDGCVRPDAPSSGPPPASPESKDLQRLAGESIERYRLLIELMPVGMALYEVVADAAGYPRDYRVLEVNPAFERLVRLQAADLVGRTIREIWPNAERGWIEAYDRAALTGQMTHFERYSPATDRTLEVEAYTPAPGRLAVILHDITERRQLEQEREATMALLGLVNASNGVRDLMKTVITFLQNWSGCEAVGVRLREGEDFPYYEVRGFPDRFVRAENYLCARDLNGQLLRDEVGNAVLECMCGNVLCGRYDPAKPFFTAHGSFWSNHTTALLASTTEADRQARTRNRCNGEGYESVALVPLRSGDVTFGLIQLNDKHIGRFTPERIALFERLADSIAQALEQKLTQQALIESENRYRTLIAHTPDIVMRFSRNGRHLFVSPSVASVTDLAPEAFLGKTHRELGFPEALCDYWESAIETVWSSGEPLRSEFEFDGKNGPVVFDWRLIPERDAYGEVQSILSVSRDITAIKRAEKERLEIERRLLQSQKLESLGVLAGGVAHDFNNLLAAIIGNLELAEDDLPPLTPARVYIEEAAQAAKRAADLTRQMLAYSGKGRFAVTRLNLSDLVRENVHLLRAAIPSKVTLTLRLADDLPPVRADAGQIQQVIVNLVTNAGEAIGAQAGVVTLSTGVQMCDAAYLNHSRLNDQAPPGRYAWLEVADTGCGMSAETQQRLFEPFFTTKMTGRGLGMPAVLGIVRGHKGAIMIDSAVGEGATVRVLLPIAEAEPEAAAAPAVEAQGAPARAGVVLVVDDEAMVQTFCRRMVERMGWRTLGAADGVEAAEIYREHAQEIIGVLLDITMPHLDGIATLRELRRINPEVKVILCSGFDEEADAQHLIAQGAAGFIHKPFGAQALRAELERVLGAPS